MCGLKFRLVRRSGTIGGEDTLTDMNRQSLSFRIISYQPSISTLWVQLRPVDISTPHFSMPPTNVDDRMRTNAFLATTSLQFILSCRSTIDVFNGSQTKKYSWKGWLNTQGKNQWSTASWGHCGGVHVLQVLRQGNPWDFQVFVGAHSFFFFL